MVVLGRGYQCDGRPEEKQHNEVSCFPNVVGLLQLAAEPVQEYHIEQEWKAYVAVEEKASSQTPYLDTE